MKTWKIMAVAVLAAGVAQADTIVAQATGSITNNATWTGGVAPVSGDSNTWRTGARTLNASGGGITFYGQTLEITTGGTFRNGEASSVVDTVRNVTLNSGGTLDHPNNTQWNLSLGNNTFTLNGGTLRYTLASIQIRNASLAGSGTIAVARANTTVSSTDCFDLASSVDTSGFTGIFDVKSYGRLNLAAITTNNASFGLIISGTGKLINDANIALTSLTLGTDVIANGVYTVSALNTAGYGAYFTNPTGTQTITVIPEPATLGLIVASASLLLAVRRLMV